MTDDCDLGDALLRLVAFLPLGSTFRRQSWRWRSNASIVRSVFSSTWGLSVMVEPRSAIAAADAWKRFYYLYGTAMAGWAGIEMELATVFVLMSGIKPDMAMQIMFAIKGGFSPRSDVFKAALSVSSVHAGALRAKT